jgi:hypothetical protein
MAGTTVDEGGAVYRCLQETLASAGVGVSESAVHDHLLGTIAELPQLLASL